MINENLLKEIKEYCVVNELSDIETTVNEFLLTGFNIARYGSSPFDNFNKEKKIVSEPIIVEMKKISKDNEIINPPIESEVKPKKAIRIIKNK